MNYSLEITKSLVPKHLKSLGYSELKRSYSTDTILNIEGRWYSTKAIGGTNLKGKPYPIEVFLKNDYALSDGLIIKTSIRNTSGSSDMKAFGYYDDLTLTAMADCGIVEEGYARASYEKGFSAVRVPWLAKNPQLDNNFEGDPVNDTKDFLWDKIPWEE